MLHLPIDNGSTAKGSFFCDIFYVSNGGISFRPVVKMGNMGLRRQAERDAALGGTVISAEKRCRRCALPAQSKNFCETVETAPFSLPPGITGLKPRC